MSLPKGTTVTPVELQPTHGQPTDDQGLWVAIRYSTKAIDYEHYANFINAVFKLPDSKFPVMHQFKERFNSHIFGDGSGQSASEDGDERAKSGAVREQESDCSIPIQGPYAYKALKFATEVFLMLNAGFAKTKERFLVDPKYLNVEADRLAEAAIGKPELIQMIKDYFGNSSLPYYDNIINTLVENTPVDLPFQVGILKNRFNCPSMIELIWSYWLEEGMLIQTMNAISIRFQNRRNGPRDPLAQFELDPLHPLNNLLWGFIQDENNRLSIQRRAYEYDHHYGFKLIGKAVKQLDSADSRSNFIRVFHNLLNQTAIYYQEKRDTTIYPDGFPLLNAIRDVHMQLTEGMHNQYGDLPTQSRVEMLMMKWLLARPEMREFLRGRHMVRYNEPWMGAVDAMKKLQGWSDVTVTHFRDLAVYGERILLSLRFADWIDEDNNHDNALNWAEYWRTEIQGYNHAYKMVTGVDLTARETRMQESSVRYAQPSQHLSRRLNEQKGNKSALSAPTRGQKAIAHELSENAEWIPAPQRLRLPRYEDEE